MLYQTYKITEGALAGALSHIALGVANVVFARFHGDDPITLLRGLIIVGASIIVGVVAGAIFVTVEGRVPTIENFYVKGAAFFVISGVTMTLFVPTELNLQVLAFHLFASAVAGLICAFILESVFKTR